tara:strand:- start:4882 stop:5550 length:669 start_codon:yes stop_codon:yes gene_type:complete
MKINKQKFVQLMKEAYNKRLVTEDGEEQGSSMEKPAADVTAVIKQVNSRLQGRMEYSEASKAFLEYVLEFVEEGATKAELINTCKSLLGDAGVQAAEYLSKMAKVYRNRKGREEIADMDPQKVDQIKTIKGDNVSMQQFTEEIAQRLQGATAKTLPLILGKVIDTMKANSSDARGTIDEYILTLLQNLKKENRLPEFNIRVGSERVTDILELYDLLQQEAGI